MTLATWILVGIALVLLVVAWRREGDSPGEGIRKGWETLKRTIPVLLAAFVIVGYIEVLSPQSLVEQWLGPQSGLRGILIAEATGILLPGGPYVVFPIIAVLYETGAGIGPTITLVSSWATLSFIGVSFELPFMGWRFTAVRWGLGLLVPLFAGLATWVLFGGG